MRIHPPAQSKAVPPFQLEIGGEVHTPPGLSEAGVAGGSDCLCPGSRLFSFWQVWETRNAHPRVVTILKEGYCLNFRIQPPLTNYPAIIKEQVFEPGEAKVFDKGGLSNDRQKSNNSSSKDHFPGIFTVGCFLSQNQERNGDL